MNSDLIARNRKFVIAILKTIKTLPNDRIYDPLTRQLVRCSTSVGANYRAACRAKSTADFIYKLKIVLEEADETCYFLDIIREINEDGNMEHFNSLLREANELVAIYVASIITAQRRRIDK